MRILVMGGTAWLGARIAQDFVRGGHEVVCLARGRSGRVPVGAEAVLADRAGPGAYENLDGAFDVVVELARDPAHVRSAVAALSGRAEHWVLVSSTSVYARGDEPGADEGADLLAPFAGPQWTPQVYGEGKVTCEQLILDAVGPDRALVARAGLIGGPGDHTDRTGYWPWRFAHPVSSDLAVLVPHAPEAAAQIIDVRDLSTWLVSCAERGAAGIVNACGPSLPFAEFVALARRVAGHSGPVVEVGQQWLQEHEVQPWAGARSMPVWLPSPEYDGFLRRSRLAALDLGLPARPVEQTLADTLAWELGRDAGRTRAAGLADVDERQLLAAARTPGSRS